MLEQFNKGIHAHLLTHAVVKVDKNRRKYAAELMQKDSQRNVDALLVQLIGSGLYDLENNFGEGPSVTKPTEDNNCRIYSDDNIERVIFQAKDMLRVVFHQDIFEVDTKMLSDFFSESKNKKAYCELSRDFQLRTVGS